MFVVMGGLITADGSQGRVAAYVVSGIGFLGGGVILKDGFNIHGLNTAATLWGTATVGTLAGLGAVRRCRRYSVRAIGAGFILAPLHAIARYNAFFCRKLLKTKWRRERDSNPR